jgi:hypothetical protein
MSYLVAPPKLDYLISFMCLSSLLFLGASFSSLACNLVLIKNKIYRSIHEELYRKWLEMTFV